MVTRHWISEVRIWSEYGPFIQRYISKIASLVAHGTCYFDESRSNPAAIISRGASITNLNNIN